MNMMLLRGFAIAGSALVAASCLAQMQMQDTQRTFVATDKNAYLMLPPSVICGPEVQQMIWSMDGERLAAVRYVIDLTPDAIRDMVLQKKSDGDAKPKVETQIVVWHMVSRKADTIFKLDEDTGRLLDTQWLAGSSKLLLTVSYKRDEEQGSTLARVLFVNNDGTTVSIGTVDTRTNYEVTASPYSSLAAICDHPASTPTAAGPGATPPTRPPSTVRFFGPSGVLGEPFTMPVSRSFLFWGSNGKAYALTFQQDARTKQNKKIWYLANGSTHKFEVSEAPPNAAGMPNEPTPEIMAQSLPARASVRKVGVNAPTVILSAVQEQKDFEPGVVTTDGASGELSPKLNGVSFVSQGTAMVRGMVKVPLDDYKRAKTAALRVKLMSQAKQVALSFIMYASDMDDVLPGNKGNWQNLLDPYMKDMSMFDGFNYSYPGGDMTKIESPADTVLGYIEGPGGRAVAYTDGHVKWIPNP